MSDPSDEKIICQIDGARCHTIKNHIKENHPDWTIELYQEHWPDAPLMSAKAQGIYDRRKAEILAASKDVEASPASAPVIKSNGGMMKAFHEVFEIGEVPAALNTRKQPIMIETFDHTDEDLAALVPDIDRNYVFQLENTKDIIAGIVMSMPIYLWGFHGTGKTSNLEQICARTGRAFNRVQHTVNTEESHIVGQYVVKNGCTEFQLGPLAEAMLKGHVYCADEYDRAIAPVISVYQPVLEGKALVIKEAPPELRVIRPHENFRFVATGNTNGCGDETGLYQGTQMQDSANYSRFAVTIEVPYMEPKIETLVVAQQAGIKTTDAEKLVSFANYVRDAYKGGTIGSTVSPRELINAGKNGLLRGCNWKKGLQLAYSARLSRVDRETVDQFAQRVFG